MNQADVTGYDAGMSDQEKVLPCPESPTGWAPRVTEVLRIVQPEALVEWKVRQAVRHALERWHEYDPAEDLDLFLDAKMPEYLAAINRASERNREIGNDLHALTAQRDTGKLVSAARFAESQACFYIWDRFAVENVEEFMAVEAPVRGEIDGLWYVGTTDRYLRFRAGTRLGYGAEPLAQATPAVVDFKYSQSGKFYPEWAIQIGAYGKALAVPPETLGVSVRFYPDGRLMAIKNWGPLSTYVNQFAHRLMVWYDLYYTRLTA